MLFRIENIEEQDSKYKIGINIVKIVTFFG